MNGSHKLSFAAFCCLLVFGLCLYTFWGPKALRPGQEVTRDWRGQPVTYRFQLEAGHFAALELQQLGVDLVMKLSGPNKKTLVTRDSVQQNMGREMIAVLAPESGTYQLEMTAFGPEPAGAYKLSLLTTSQPDEANLASVKATALMNEAWALYESNNPADWEKAPRLLEAAATAWQQAGEPLQQAVAHLNLAGIYQNLDKWRNRLAQMKEAIPLLKSAGERELLAQAHLEIGTVLATRDSYEADLNFEKASDLRSQPCLARAKILEGRAMVNRFIGNYQEASKLLAEAQKIHIVHGNNQSWAAFLDHSGELLLQKGQIPEAILKFKEALARNPEFSLKIGILTRLGNAHILLEEYVEALSYLRQALVDIPPSYESYRYGILYHIGLVYFHLEKHELALEKFRRAADDFAGRDSKDEYLKAVEYCAKSELALGNQKQALWDIERALDILEQCVINIRNPKNKLTYTAIRYDTLDMLVDLVLGLGQKSETVRQRLLERLDRFRDLGLAYSLNYVELKDLRKSISLLELQRISCDPESPLYEELEREIDGAYRRYDQMFEYQLGGFKSDQSKPTELNLEKMQRLLSPEDLVLFYALGKENIYLLAIGATSFESYNVGSRKEIEKYSESYVSWIKTRGLDRGPKNLVAEDSSIDGLLPKHLLATTGTKRLIIVADGDLHYLPFGTFSNPSTGRLLVEDFELVHVPSMGVLAALRQRSPARGQSIAVVAAPTNSEEDLPPLPHAKREAELIAEMELSTVVLTGTKANKANILADQLAPYRVLHFACHSLLNPHRSELSSLVLADVNELGQSRDKFLYVHEIEDLELKADLVVLSACQTGLGQDIRGVGPLGLPQAFLTAGAKNVFVSLWRVDDEGTMILMKNFYRYMLKQGLSPAQALRAAQTDMSRGDKWSDPYFWAGFRLIGDWRISKVS